MRKLSSLFLAFFLSTIAVLAQDTTGRIVGTVSAPDGAVPGATIVVTDNQTGKQRTVTTSEDGTFSVSQLEFGTYTVRITAQGFKAFTATEVKIDAGREYPLNAQLEIGEVTQEVTVTAGAETINATNAELATTVSRQQIRELPLNGRNPLSLLNLQAGANPTTSSINGQRSSATAVTRDGLNVQDNFIRTGTFVSDQPTVDDTGEFTVTTQNAGAEQGGGTVQVQLVTPRGGSEFHGNLFAFNRNSAFTANSFFNNANNVQRPFLNRNQFGGSISGPVPLPNFGEGGPVFEKDRGFFFFNYERFWLAQQATINNLTTLLPAARTGNFTYIDASGTQRTVNVLTGQGFGSPITAAQGGVLSVDPIIQNRLLNRLPNSGNGVTTGINFLQTVSVLRSDPRIRNSYTGRFDVDINDRNTFNVVYRRNDDVDARTDIGAGFSNNVFVSTTGPTDFLAVAYRTTIGNNFSNEIRGGFQDSGVIFDEGNSIPTDYLIGQTLFTSPEGTFRTQGRNTLYRNIQNNAVYTWGNHSLRFGGNADFQETEALNLAGTTPTYNISSTANPNTPGLIANQFTGGISTTDLARANALRYLLGGIVGSGTLTANLGDNGNYGFQPSIFRLNYKILSAYVSDQWRVRPNLTLNLGLRYEFYTPLNNPDGRYLEPVIPDINNLQSITNPNGVLNYVGTNAGTPGNFFNADKDNFGPTFSFAYSPKFENGLLAGLTGGDTVIRGGFRVNYLNDEYLRAPDAFNQANAGLGSVNAFATRANGSTNLRSTFSPAVNVAFEALPGFNVPSLTPPPRAFVLNNPTRLGAIFGVDPNYQVPRIYEYNFGIQREIGFKTVLEVRYVGNRSNDMIRSIDFNQIDTTSNGFLADFLRAQNNCRIQGATLPGTGDPLFRCTNAGNIGLPGQQALTVFPNLVGGGNLTNSTNLQFIQQGLVGSLVQNYIGLGQQGTVVFQPTTQAYGIELLTNGGTFRYNALQAEVRRRFSAGLYFQVNYTFQKTLGDVPNDSQVRQSPYLDNNNPKLDYGRPDYDRTHTLNANMIYELPFGKGKRFLNQGGLVDLIFGGFQFGSIVNLSSGPPLGIIDPRGTFTRPGRAGRQSAKSSLTTNEIKDLTGVFNTPNGIYFVNPKVLYATGSNGQRVDLTQPLPPGVTLVSVRAASPLGQAPFEGQVFFFNQAGEFGNLPRNFINGLPYVNWDASLSKNIRFTETMRLQLRAEAFNVLNRQVPFFGADLNIDSNNFGRVTSTYNTPRILQFGARFDF
ncbi:MAG: TonB-dependent receptor [Acidobacteriota bacterium]|nr:TonB-dependent receptor [Acidobacteriota bacterium]